MALAVSGAAQSYADDFLQCFNKDHTDFVSFAIVIFASFQVGFFQNFP